MTKIAQLIKLRDYISRYEWNIYRYPTQFIRLKQEKWTHLHGKWLIQQQKTKTAPPQQEKVSESRLKRWRTSIFRVKDVGTKAKTAEASSLPASETALIQYFLNKLFPFQLRWASSTVSQVSFTSQEYEQDELLHYFLQRFPDTYLVMYHPVFMVQQVPVEAEIILISPVGAEIIYMLEKDTDTVVIAGHDRTWEIAEGTGQTTVLSPLIALKRTEQIVQSIFRKHDVDFPVRKTVLSRTNEIRFASEPHHTSYIGKTVYKDWFKAKRQMTSPLKSRQLKAAGALLSSAQTIAVNRPEWQKQTDHPDSSGEHPVE